MVCRLVSQKHTLHQNHTLYIREYCNEHYACYAILYIKLNYFSTNNNDGEIINKYQRIQKWHYNLYREVNIYYKRVLSTPLVSHKRFCYTKFYCLASKTCL